MSVFQVLKTRLALSKTGQYRGMFDAALKIRQKEGYRSFYRGFAPNLIGIIPYAGIELGIYETLKTRISQTKEPGILVTLSCATVGSIMGQLCAYPLALVRTKLQAQAIRSDAAEHRPSGMIHVFQTILRTEGWTGLYRGLAPNFLKVLPAVAISYVVYEESRVALGLTTA
ncbi:unnamed protein product [Notodromas monacha]|uniref:Uncharacterized protein n=1 Tax=Notodromas monacha TaxID=399045 RepID=A0A7R9C035_9CRUS|nr:unnamed protein product [Notodromas monacha]CAG0924965.1 unnamed protein product [Notodromas monacha]